MPLQLYTVTQAGLALLAACLGEIAVAQTSVPSLQGIYTCVDGTGRKITSDRPIAECMDRVQREINPSGTVRRVVPPQLTPPERAALEEKEKVAAEVRAREDEDKRRDRALLLRYPSRELHDKERAEALSQVGEVIKASNKRSQELAEQRKAINADLEFYKDTPGRAPASLKRRLEENDSSVAMQKRFIVEQDAEKKRVNQRFDVELGKLKQLWAAAGVAAQGKPAPAPVAVKK
ncbi:DUF4124 domain-containing protein [Polaromonas eurypsychrophila]|nr:DUF4124 domain-containing protein [Polaromonas eurypsychrophila]